MLVHVPREASVLAMDVHKNSISTATLEPGSTSMVTDRVGTDDDEVRRLVELPSGVPVFEWGVPSSVCHTLGAEFDAQLAPLTDGEVIRLTVERERHWQAIAAHTSQDPGNPTPPLDHPSWGAAATVAGAERNVRYTGTCPDQLRELGQEVVPDGYLFGSGDIHQAADAAGRTVSLHLLTGEVTTPPSTAGSLSAKTVPPPAADRRRYRQLADPSGDWSSATPFRVPGTPVVAARDHRH